MHCPFCKNDDTKVIDSRGTQDGAIRRRRECLACERRFTTYEKIEDAPLKVVKKDGTRVPFSREKLKAGLEKACYKRPIRQDDIERLVSVVEAEMYESFNREVDSRMIGEAVMDHLRDLDGIAYVRFASVYREFADVEDFTDTLEHLPNRLQRF